jgi:predicted ATPase
MKLLDEIVGFPLADEIPPDNFRPLTELPFVILIGLTGVGKSTVLQLLRQAGPEFTLLPNRRDIADQIIIASLQREDGHPFYPVLDRVKRFEYTARYRTKYAGGTAHALSKLVVDPAKAKPLLIFDGLRGLDEVQHAVTYFPQARFVVLDASDMVRLTRLLKREDAFDTTTVRFSLASQNLIASFMEVPDIEAVFDEEQLRQIARLARAAKLSSDDVLKKITIIVEERRNYDPDTARVFLTRTQSSHPVLGIDTTQHNAAEIAQKIAAWLA